jgi:HEPN domain-containing protein
MNQSFNKKLENANRLRQIGYWVDSAAHDLDVAETLFKSGKYDWCLFIAYLFGSSAMDLADEYSDIY